MNFFLNINHNYDEFPQIFQLQMTIKKNSVLRFSIFLNSINIHVCKLVSHF